MSTVKKTISIDEHIVNEAGAISSNFSAVVETALIEYIQRQRTLKAVKSFGAWGQRNEKSEEIVSSMRSQDNREC